MMLDSHGLRTPLGMSAAVCQCKYAQIRRPSAVENVWGMKRGVEASTWDAFVISLILVRALLFAITETIQEVLNRQLMVSFPINHPKQQCFPWISSV